MFIIENSLWELMPELKISSCFVLAYIDPGTGSYLFQLLLAGLLGAGFAIKSFRHRISGFLQNLFHREAGPANPAEPIPGAGASADRGHAGQKPAGGDSPSSGDK